MWWKCSYSSGGTFCTSSHICTLSVLTDECLHNSKVQAFFELPLPRTFSLPSPLYFLFSPCLICLSINPRHPIWENICFMCRLQRHARFVGMRDLIWGLYVMSFSLCKSATRQPWLCFRRNWLSRKINPIASAATCIFAWVKISLVFWLCSRSEFIEA